MILEITRLERGEITSKDGNPLPGLTITGFQQNQDGELEDEPYEKFLMEWKNADEIEIVEEAGVGATVELKMKQQKGTRYWDCIGAEIIEPGAGQESVVDEEAGENLPDDADDPTVAANRELAEAKAKVAAAAKAKKARAAKAAAAKKKPKETAVKGTEETADEHTTTEKIAAKELAKQRKAAVDFDLATAETRVVALASSVALTGHMIKAPERVKGLIKSKDTPEIVTQMTLLNASKIEAFLKGDFDKDLASDTSDLKPEEVDADEPVLPGDE